MISIVKGKTEISPNLQGMLSLHFPLPLTVAEGKDRSENGSSIKLVGGTVFSWSGFEELFDSW